MSKFTVAGGKCWYSCVWCDLVQWVLFLVPLK